MSQRPKEVANDRFLSPADLETLIGIPRKTLANWRSDRVGPPYYRFGGRIRYREADVLLWLASCSVGPASGGDDLR
jgi:hypothetical protein